MKNFFLSRSGLLIATFGALSVAPSINVRSARAAPKVPDILLVTTKSIGPAKLGSNVATLKKAYPGSVVFTEDDGPVEYLTLRKNDQDLLYFVTREFSKSSSTKVRDADIISSLWTKDPHYKTAKGVGPGSWLHNAVAVYGRPRIAFSPHDESGIFPDYSDKLWFEPEAPQNPKSDYRVAGVYTAKELREVGGTTTRFKNGTKIVAIGCSEKTYF